MDGLPQNPPSSEPQEKCAEDLQKALRRLNSVEQELIRARIHLDQELQRFSRIQDFNSRAMRIEDHGAFATLVAEAIVDIFEVEFGAFWSMGDPGLIPPESASTIPLSGELMDSLRRHLLQQGGSGQPQLLDPAHLPSVFEPLGLRQVIFCCSRTAEGRITGILLGATTEKHASFYDSVSTEQLTAFNVLGQLVRTLLENFQSRALIHRQMHALQNAQEKEREARQLAESASQAKSDFLANMSHEIRTPMNGVLGMLQLLLDLNPSPQQAEYLRSAERAASSLLAILGDILDISRIEAGRLQLEQVPFDLSQTVRDVVGLFEASARTRGIDLQLDSAELPRVLGDPSRLRQVLLNLVSNALKFTPRGHVRVSVSQIRDGFEFRIQDTGIGISPENLENLFSPFGQANLSTYRRFGGSGLGLSIARRLVSMMGGEIHVESREGAGSSFFFQIPLAPAPDIPLPNPAGRGTHAPAGPRPSADLPHFKGRVLVAEDNVVSQQVARGQLERLGFSVALAANGQEALDKLRSERFVAVLMDCQMPLMDGFAATTRWREFEKQNGLARTPILALTANALSEDERACRAAGMDDFLTKPLRRELLALKLSLFLASAPPASAS
ncbi:MAG: hypothetical protein RLZZ253_136 [Verrucomicrobiota bacterium]